MIAPDRVMERAATRYEVTADGCWVSGYSVANHGYAQVGWTDSGRTYVVLAHRAAWEYVHGPIPDTLTVDHICYERRCVNVQHMRLVTRSVNSGRRSRTWPTVPGDCGHPIPQYGPDHTRPRCRRCERAALKSA